MHTSSAAPPQRLQERRLVQRRGQPIRRGRIRWDAHAGDRRYLGRRKQDRWDTMKASLLNSLLQARKNA